jgi:cytochrome c oxidase subunit 2
MIHFHGHLMFFLVFIGLFVLWMLGRSIYFFEASRYPTPEPFTHSTALEIGWTLTPALVLLFIAYPSFTLLYSMDEKLNPWVTIKVIGHQWYWSYEYSDYTLDSSLAFDSYMVGEQDLTLGGLRLLEVDNRTVLPTQTPIRILVSSADVLHSWAVPSLGVKIDACPGRLNQVSVFLKREGVFYGQCSEICGINHAFMPIVVEAHSMNDFQTWISTQLEAEDKL